LYSNYRARVRGRGAGRQPIEGALQRQQGRQAMRRERLIDRRRDLTRQVLGREQRPLAQRFG
jgi:hypothetical protein